MMRWGGIFTDFYRWREAVGPREKRQPVVNLLWGGIESNQVGTAEFVDFCRQVEAEPLMCVNFEADGRPAFHEVFTANRGRATPRRRPTGWPTATIPTTASDANTASNRTARRPLLATGKRNLVRRRDGFEPRRRHSQDDRIRQGDAPRRLRRFKLIGWGDCGWAGPMIEGAGEHLQFVAFHHMFNPDRKEEPVLAGENYRRDPAATWDVLMDAWKDHDRKIREVRDSPRRAPRAAGDDGMPFRHSGPRSLRCDVDLGDRRALRAIAQQSPAARRRAEDRHGSRLLRQALAGERGDDYDRPARPAF